MSISRKLTIMAVSSVVLMVIIVATVIYVENRLEDALDDVNHRGIPGMRSIYEVKGHQQSMAIAILRHVVSSKPEQKVAYEKAIEDAKLAFDKSMTAYEAVAQSAKGKELAKAERAAFAEYVGLLPPLLERSRANDTQGAMTVAASMAASREKMAALIEEHIELSNKYSNTQAEESKAVAQRGFFLSLASILGAAIFIGGVSVVTIRGINPIFLRYPVNRC